MQTELLTRCGYRCDLCLAYKGNIEKDDQRVFLSDTWHKIYGFRIPAKEIYCEGCISSDNPKLIDKECPVRPCVIEKGLENCSQCEDYPCDRFNQRKVVYENFAKDIDVSRTEYSKCIKPYENKKRLDEIRSNNFPFSRLLNPQITPDDAGILRFIDNKKVKDNFTDLLSFMNNSYNLERKIIFGGKKYGWAIQYKKGKKTIVTIFPERKSFTILLVFGKKELEKINDNKNILSPIIFEKIKNTKQYHDGKWMWLRIETDNYIDDIMKLIKLKRKPDNE
ncbi:MAG: DUF3788 family protein [Ignavibacteria bacterium]|jgi:hypothetical protein